MLNEVFELLMNIIYSALYTPCCVKEVVAETREWISQ